MNLVKFEEPQALKVIIRPELDYRAAVVAIGN